MKQLRLPALTVLVTTSLGSAPILRAQERDPGCDSPAAHLFDFWAGDWDVRSRSLQQDGTWLETDQEWRAEAVVGGCVLIDFADGDFSGHRMRGMGTRFYDPQTEEWVITWISTDAPGQWGEWRGTFGADGVADFIQEIETPAGTVLSRIRWSDLEQDSAHWEHGVSRDGGETWRANWVMEFRRKATSD